MIYRKLSIETEKVNREWKRSHRGGIIFGDAVEDV